MWKKDTYILLYTDTTRESTINYNLLLAPSPFSVVRDNIWQLNLYRKTWKQQPVVKMESEWCYSVNDCEVVSWQAQSH